MQVVVIDIKKSTFKKIAISTGLEITVMYKYKKSVKSVHLQATPN